MLQASQDPQEQEDFKDPKETGVEQEIPDNQEVLVSMEPLETQALQVI